MEEFMYALMRSISITPLSTAEGWLFVVSINACLALRFWVKVHTAVPAPMPEPEPEPEPEPVVAAVPLKGKR